MERDLFISKKEFIPKYECQKLDDYGTVPEEGFWDNVKKVEWEGVREMEGGIDWRRMEEMAEEYRYPYKAILGNVVTDLREGALLGVPEEDRIESRSTNAASAIESGQEVTDALIGWLHKGHAIGPFDQGDTPFEKIRISGLMCKLKPNGQARIICNMARGEPSAINDSIDKNNYPTSMSSTRAWIRIMIRCGRYCRFCKNDWSAAYKQVFIMLGVCTLLHV